MSTTALLLFLRQSIHVMPLFLLTAGCVVLLMRTRSRAALVMLIGNLILIAGAVLSAVLTMLIVGRAMDPERYGRLAMVMQFLSLIGGVTFGVGFLLMAFSTKPRQSGSGVVSPVSP